MAYSSEVQATGSIICGVSAGSIGEVGVIHATFSFRGKFDSESRIFKNELGGGGILDIGCYTTSISRLVAGAAQGKPFVNPVKLTGHARLHTETGIDLYAVAAVEFPGGILGQLGCGVGLDMDNGLRVFGTEGSLHLPTPFAPCVEGGSSSIFLQRSGAEKPEEIVVETKDHLYALEADAVADALAQGKVECPYVTVADSLGNMAALDAWRQAAGLVYESEKPEFPFLTVSGDLLKRRADAPMKYGTIAGVAPPVSRLVLGCDNQQSIVEGAVIFDDFFERGGNAFDTAYAYWEGKQERILGRWIERRGVRPQVAVIVKGAHTPFCTPEFLDEQLRASLDRLQTGYADIYLMHRDNPKIPAGEFVDLLDGYFRAGRIKSFGGSNWTLERLQEANAYAEKTGRQKFTCVSNNFSLARMVSPVWTGCVAASDSAFKKWLGESGTALLAWSSQARGFFTDRAHPDKREDAELVRCWYSDDNFQRRERAVELAREKGVPPINIALAYVLHQPFNAFALVGPRTIGETASSSQGLSVTLTPDEVRWLNLE